MTQTWPGSQKPAHERSSSYLLAAGLSSGRNVLDVGGRDGAGAFLLAREASRVLCLVASPEAMTRASERYRGKNLEFHSCALEELLPRGEGSFGLVTCLDVIQNLSTNQQHEMLASLWRLLSPSGVLFISASRRALSHGPEQTEPEMGYVQFRDLLEGHFDAAVWYAREPLSGSVLRRLPVEGESASGPGWRVEPGRSASGGLLPSLGLDFDNAPSLLAVCAKTKDALLANGLPGNLVFFDPAAREGLQKRVRPRASSTSNRGVGKLAFCVCCGGTKMRQDSVLWEDLVSAWRLEAREVAYVERQQGLCCTACNANLRSMTLAQAVMSCFGYSGLLSDFVKREFNPVPRILEINPAGQLTQFLKRMAGHRLVEYPDVDMMDLRFEDGSFDLVVHSDTLEHVPDPIRGLSECRRILGPGGFCAFTVPVIVDRMTRSRHGLRPSYHGSPEDRESYLVHTEYGADAWQHCFLAGFRECRISSILYPESQAFVAVR